MRKLLTITTAAAFAAMFVFAAGPAKAKPPDAHPADLGSDFALFDANGANLGPDGTSGGLCSVTNAAATALVVAPWRWYVSIANSTAGLLSAKVRYVDGDSISYPIPAHSSFAFTTAAGGGSIGFADIALRLVAEEGLSGSVSARGPKDSDDATVFCISCDDPPFNPPFDGDVACDFIIAD